MKILTVVGARPQFIKAATVSRRVALQPGVEEVLVHTGQHYDQSMSDVFFEEMEIPRPGYNLDVGSGSHGKQTGRMLEKLEEVILKEAPDWLLVYGDTNSTLAGALAAAKLHVPVAHVEAGLRSFNRKMPEEINRVLTDHVSTLLFAPTQKAIENLLHEGVPREKIFHSGDVMYDAALFYGKRAPSAAEIPGLGLTEKKYILATIHRAENTDDPDRLRVIATALRTVSRGAPVVLPLHPRTKAALARTGIDLGAEGNFKVIAPVGYLEMVALERSAALIVTDSGGVQKEAFFHGVPCVTLRDETEWVELLETGWNRLAPPASADSIVEQVRAAAGSRGQDVNLYGQGDAADRILSVLREARR